jgi:mannosyltransferase
LVYIDGIIYSLQKSGGVSVCFTELMHQMENEQFEYQLHLFEPPDDGRIPKTLFSKAVNHHPRLLERYRNCITSTENTIFHSSYYRLPDRKVKAVVTTVHDFTYERFVQGPRKWVHSYQKRKAVKQADAIICVSENTRNDLLYYFSEIDESRIFVIHNGVSDDFMRLPDNGLQENLFVLFVGQRGGYKNFCLLVNALILCKSLNLVCVGGGDFTDDEVQLLETKLPGRYRHAGSVTNAVLNRLYNEAVCLAYPSLYEGFGLPVIEAMKAGCPVVAMAKSSIPEIAGSAAILIDESTPEALAQAIFTISGYEKNQREALIMEGLKQASGFSWKKNAASIMSLYQKLL